METSHERNILQQYSRGEISRAEVSRRLGTDLTFGETLIKLWKYDLGLPRYKTDLNSPAIKFICELVNQNSRDGYQRIEQASRNASRPTILDEQDESASKAITAMLHKNKTSST
jgi:hypothetical protein